MGSIDSRLTRITMALQPFMLNSSVPSFEQFKTMWSESDELSRSLIELSISCPALAGDMDDEHRTVIGRYLREMGIEVTVETATLEELIARLESDP